MSCVYRSTELWLRLQPYDLPPHSLALTASASAAARERVPDAASRGVRAPFRCAVQVKYVQLNGRSPAQPGSAVAFTPQLQTSRLVAGYSGRVRFVGHLRCLVVFVLSSWPVEVAERRSARQICERVPLVVSRPRFGIGLGHAPSPMAPHTAEHLYRAGSVVDFHGFFERHAA